MHGIGRQTDYASRIVLHLACLGEGAQVTVKEIAEKRLVPAAFMRRIVAQLANSGILLTTRGMGGGIRLARPPGEISLLDLVRVVEGGIVLNRCVEDPEVCPVTIDCPVQRVWIGATRQVETYLGAVRFDQLASEAIRNGQGYSPPDSVQVKKGTGEDGSPRRDAGE